MKKRIVLVLSLLFVLTACSTGNIMKDYKGFDKKDHHFVALNGKEGVENLQNKKTGIYYIGYPECPFCTDMVPVFEEVLTELDQKALYINPQKDFDESTSKLYQEFVKSLPESLQSDGVPFVIVIDEDQTIRTFSPSVKSTSPGNHKLTENQIEYLRIKLTQVIKG